MVATVKSPRNSQDTTAKPTATPEALLFRYHELPSEVPIPRDLLEATLMRNTSPETSYVNVVTLLLDRF